VGVVMAAPPADGMHIPTGLSAAEAEDAPAPSAAVAIATVTPAVQRRAGPIETRLSVEDNTVGMLGQRPAGVIGRMTRRHARHASRAATSNVSVAAARAPAAPMIAP